MDRHRMPLDRLASTHLYRIEAYHVTQSTRESMDNSHAAVPLASCTAHIQAATGMVCLSQLQILIMKHHLGVNWKGDIPLAMDCFCSTNGSIFGI